MLADNLLKNFPYDDGGGDGVRKLINYISVGIFMVSQDGVFWRARSKVSIKNFNISNFARSMVIILIFNFCGKFIRKEKSNEMCAGVL